MDIAPLKRADMPKPLALKRLLGPSFILLGLGLGSGEIVLWPYLSANYGLGIIWAAVVGITLQFFLNMEIARYTLATGESIFVGFARRLGKLTPPWFIASTLIPWMWPGLAAASGKILAAAFNISYTSAIPVAILLFIGVVLSSGTVLYKTQERFQKGALFVGVPFILVLTVLFLTPDTGGAFISGLFGNGILPTGETYFMLPAGISIATFLGALAYAGAGGNLNLSQSLYIKEKGYGMGAYAKKLKGLFALKSAQASITGTTFELTQQNKRYFSLWWKRVNIEHAAVFWATGLTTMVALSVLSYETAYGHSGVTQGISFVTIQSKIMGEVFHPFVATAFLVVTGMLLMFTQFSVFGSTSRIMAENLVLSDDERFPARNSSQYFYVFLWLQILAGIAILQAGFTEPLVLVTVSAVLNAFSMFIYSIFILITNESLLPTVAKATIFRTCMLISVILFYGFFAGFVIFQTVT